MRSLLTSTDPTDPHRVAIWGVGGAGKTQLAFHYALQYEKEFSAVFYINAKDATSFRKDCFGIARTLKLPEVLGGSASDPAQDAVVEAVRDWLTDHERGDWLLIVDNADNLDEFNPIHYLPAINKGHIILTSRDQHSVGFGHAIELGGMQADDAQQLFLKRSGFKHSTEEQRDISLDIVTKLGLLALPVEHAAAYVQSTGMLLHEYLENLERNLQPYLMNPSPFSLHKETIQTTVNMAWNAISKRNAMARELLAFLAHLNNGGIGEFHFSSPSTETMFRNWKIHTNRADYLSAIEVLHSFSLVQSARVDDVEVIVSMHASVRHCIRALFNAKIKWLLLHRAAAFIYTIAKGKPLDGSLFLHVRDILSTATELFSQPDHGEPPNGLWLILAAEITRYRYFWGITGLAYELEKVSKVVMQALGQEESVHNRIMIANAMIGRLAAADYTSSSDSMETVLRDYLIDQMTPAAAEFMRQVHKMGGMDSQVADFNPYSLVDVLKHQTPPEYVDLILTMLKAVAPVYIGQSERTTLGIIYLRLSQLPKSETWMTQGRRLLRMASPLTHPLDTTAAPTDPASFVLTAARDRALGNMDSTISLLRLVIDTSKPLVVAGPVEAATYDLAKLLHSLNRNAEAATVLRTLKYADDNTTEVSIA